MCYWLLIFHLPLNTRAETFLQSNHITYYYTVFCSIVESLIAPVSHLWIPAQRISLLSHPHPKATFRRWIRKEGHSASAASIPPASLSKQPKPVPGTHGSAPWNVRKNSGSDPITVTWEPRCLQQNMVCVSAVVWTHRSSFCGWEMPLKVTGRVSSMLPGLQNSHWSRYVLSVLLADLVQKCTAVERILKSQAITHFSSRHGAVGLHLSPALLSQLSITYLMIKDSLPLSSPAFVFSPSLFFPPTPFFSLLPSPFPPPSFLPPFCLFYPASLSFWSFPVLPVALLSAIPFEKYNHSANDNSQENYNSSLILSACLLPRMVSLILFRLRWKCVENSMCCGAFMPSSVFSTPSLFIPLIWERNEIVSVAFPEFCNSL